MRKLTMLFSSCDVKMVFSPFELIELVYYSYFSYIIATIATIATSTEVHKEVHKLMAIMLDVNSRKPNKCVT